MFNTEKLDWMNGQDIARMPIERAGGGRRAVLRATQALDGASARTAWFQRLLDLLRPRAKRLTDFVDLAQPVPRGYG